MSDPALVALYGALAAILTAVVGAIATRVQLLPEVIDLSLVPTGSGFGSLVLALYGAYADAGLIGSADSPSSGHCWAAWEPL